MTQSRYDFDFLHFNSNIYKTGDTVYCTAEEFGLTEKECRNHLDNLCIEQNRSMAISELMYMGIACIVGIGAIFLLWHFDEGELFAKYSLTFIAICVTILMASTMRYLHCPSLLKKIFYPKENAKIENFFYVMNERYWKWNSGTNEDRIELLSYSDSGYKDFRQAVLEELAHPSEDCAIGDVRFGMTLDELYETKVLKGLRRVDNPMLNSIRSTLLGEIFVYSNPIVTFNLIDGRLHYVEVMWWEIIPYLPMMDEEKAEEACDIVINNIKNGLKKYYGEDCKVGKKFLAIEYEQYSMPKVEIHHSDYYLRTISLAK